MPGYPRNLSQPLPSLGEAHSRMTELDGISALHGPLKDVLLRHSLTGRYGISLLHSHFHLPPTHSLVHFGNVSLPRAVHELEPATQNKIRASSWAFMADGVSPVEFTYGQSDEVMSEGPAVDAAFFTEFQSVLFGHGLESVFGITSIQDAVIGIELTQGEANITLPPESFAAGDREDAIEALWTFTEYGKGYCVISCVRMGSTHLLHHIHKEL